MVNQRTEIDQLNTRVDALEKLLQDTESRMAALRAENDKQRQEVHEQLTAVDSTLKAAAADRDAIKKEIIDDLTPKIAAIMRPPPSPSPSAQSTAPRSPAASGKGREHTVQAGETLSAIATLYKVKVNAIIQANDLKTPDALKVGQRLIIPE
jgi:LysM repeat protein